MTRARGELSETLHAIAVRTKRSTARLTPLGFRLPKCPDSVSDTDIDTYLQPFVRSEQRIREPRAFPRGLSTMNTPS